MEEPINNTPTSTGGKKIIWIIVVIAVLGLGLAAYFLLLRPNSPVKTGLLGGAGKLNSSCKYNDPDLCKFINNWKDIKYFTVNSTSTFEGKPIKMVLMSAGDDRTQIINYEDNAEGMNIITIGKDTYTKDYTDNKWVKTTQEASANDSITKDFNFDDKAELAQDQTTYKKIGTEACGKLTCFKYQVLDTSIPDSTEYILFDNKQYMLRKTISIGKDNNRAEAEFDYSKISIDVPSPVKDSIAIPSDRSSADTPITSGATSTTQNSPSVNSDASVSSEDIPVDTGDTEVISE